MYKEAGKSHPDLCDLDLDIEQVDLIVSREATGIL
jgi:general stress protein 26